MFFVKKNYSGVRLVYYLTHLLVLIIPNRNLDVALENV